MKPETALRKSTASKRKVDRVLLLNKITAKDIEGFNKYERDYLATTINEALLQLTGEEKDKFYSKIEHILPESSKNQLWEHNHLKISAAVANLMSQHGCMPAKNAIAAQTGLSRQTVVKHFATYKAHPVFIAEIEQFKLMVPIVMAKVFKFAGNGDMRAARLYLEMAGAINKNRSNTVVNEQNNYIQINNTILSQENLKHLSTEQLNQIEKYYYKARGIG